MRTVPDWWIQVAWSLFGICATGALWYFLSTNNLVYAGVSGFLAALFAVVAIFLHRKKDEFASDNTAALGEVKVQTGDVNLTNLDRTRIEVRYARPFESTPNLVVESFRGSIELRILEERPDGFSLRGGSSTSSGLDGLWIRWTAKGVLKAT